MVKLLIAAALVLVPSLAHAAPFPAFPGSVYAPWWGDVRDHREPLVAPPPQEPPAAPAEPKSK